MRTQVILKPIERTINHIPYSLHLSDCLDWMESRKENSIHAIVTDPPYGLREYSAKEKLKLMSSESQRSEDRSHEGSMHRLHFAKLTMVMGKPGESRL